MPLTRCRSTRAGPLTDAFRSGSAVIVHGEVGRGIRPLFGATVDAAVRRPDSRGAAAWASVGWVRPGAVVLSDELRFVAALAEEAGEALEAREACSRPNSGRSDGRRGCREVTARLARAVRSRNAREAILRGATGARSRRGSDRARGSGDGQVARAFSGRSRRNPRLLADLDRHERSVPWSRTSLGAVARCGSRRRTCGGRGSEDGRGPAP